MFNAVLPVKAVFMMSRHAALLKKQPVTTNYDKIVSEVSRLIDDKEYYDTMSQAVNPYGDGMACPRIVDVLR